MKNEFITFKDGTLELNVPVSWEQETVWLTRNQMAELFDRDVKTIGKHINNALKEELDNSTVANFETIHFGYFLVLNIFIQVAFKFLWRPIFGCQLHHTTARIYFSEQIHIFGVSVDIYFLDSIKSIITIYTH